MRQHWEKLEAYLKANNPELLSDLNPPASDAEIRELEEQLGVVLPAAFVECLKVHNGQKGDVAGLFNGLEYLSNSVYLPPRPNSFNPRLAMAADKPRWTEPSESGTYGDCKVLRSVVNRALGECGNWRGRIGRPRVILWLASA